MASGAQTYDMWINASSLTKGVLLEVDRSIAENMCWLWPVNDTQHINLAEWDAIQKGVNLALQRGCISSWFLHMQTSVYQTCSLAKPEYELWWQVRC